MTNRITLILAFALSLAGCTAGIPLFDQHARTLNRIASCEELLIEINNEVVQLRADGLIDQATINKAITPSLKKAEAIMFTARAVARGTATTQPTTQPGNTIDDAKSLLLSVKAVLLQIKGPSQ